jgi:hypothetical protein
MVGQMLGPYRVLSKVGEGGIGEVYRSNETGRWEVDVQSYPPGNGKWQMSTDGGGQGMWAPTGRELFCKSGNRMMVVDVELGATFKPGTRRVLFEMPLPDRAPGDPDRSGVTPDAQRFLVLTTATSEKGAVSTPPITVVLNWTLALKRSGAFSRATATPGAFRFPPLTPRNRGGLACPSQLSVNLGTRE